MSHGELIDQWNNVISFKITELDLSKPNEQFLTNALISYLEAFNMDVSRLNRSKDSNYAETRRLFKIDLCSYINYLYKISDSSKTFYYCDLVKPSPKKTTHLLTILMNYLLYFNMVKTEIVSKAAEKIRERDEILQRKIAFMAENEKNKIKSESIKECVEKYQAELPKLDLKIECKKKECNDLTEKISEHCASQKNYENLLQQLVYEESELRSNIVAENEVENLLVVKKSTEKNIAEQEEIEKAMRCSIQENAATLNKLQFFLQEMDNLLAQYPLEDITSSTSLKATYDDVAKKCLLQKNINEKKLLEIKEFTEKYRELENVANEKSKILQNTTDNMVKSINEMNMSLKSETRTNENLQSKLDQKLDEINVQKDNQEFMLISAEQVFKRIRNKNVNM